ALAWVTYCEGAGSITNIALDRALASDPGYLMALMLRTALDNAMSPEFLRGTTSRIQAALEECA
ncbi:MAG: DUF4192 family protein, partial [Mycobacteriales bacterium]